tara:strand:- start:2614 stop:3069 length:456 start_codon:yes stop_codon:yes gene_type:complete
MKEPTIHRLRKDLGLPSSAKFLGWVIHHPERDEFLVAYTVADGMVQKGWGLTPEKAKHFKRLKKTVRVISELEITDCAEAVPAFDIGKQIVVATSVNSTQRDGVSPFRAGFFDAMVTAEERRGKIMAYLLGGTEPLLVRPAEHWRLMDSID